MILIDSLHINIGGGKILLDYLVEELEKRNLNVFYLLDSRCKGEYNQIPLNRKIFIKAGPINRIVFYLKNKKKFNTIFCFASIPPPIKYKNNIAIYTYFQQYLFIDDVKKKSLRFIWTYIKIAYVKSLKNNTNYWIVQNRLVKEKLGYKYNIPQNYIEIIPFFKSLNIKTNKKTPNSFAYISTAPPHKNHSKLIEAWNILKSKNITPILHVTVPSTSVEVINIIDNAIQNGALIINHGYISKTEVIHILSISEYLIYPSLAESFGLPLVEAVDAGCKVISADLDYVYQVIEPSYTFDPFSAQSIANAVEMSFKNNLPPSKKIINNDIINLIKMISES